MTTAPASATFSVNGQEVTHSGEHRTHLADFLREDMALTGTHIGCEHGVCGACTLMQDGRPVRSCITYAAACAGRDIRTIEDFSDDPLMARLRAAFKQHHGLQCGFCTPGMLATGYDIVTRLPDADEARIREELSGNLCRCTGYMGIVAAIRAVLAEGPHAMPAAPARTPTISAGPLPGTVPSGTARPPAALHGAVTADTPPALPASRPAPLTDGTRLHRAVDLDLPADQLWPVLRDIHAVAACLPGAAIEQVDAEGRVIGSYTTRIGPMKASFRGTAYVDYDDAARTGTVSGSGGDGSSRSRAQGQIGFSLTDRDAATPGCRLKVEMLYKIGGPLAQIGRPGIVAAVVDQILDSFTANLVARAQGRNAAAEPAAAPGTLALLFGVIRRIVRLPKRG